MARSQALLNILNLVDASTDAMPIEQQFLCDLRASIEMQATKEGRKPSQSYKPSSLHCIRNMYYQVMGVETEADRATSDFVGICESGTDRHERIQNAVMNMKENGIDCEYVNVADYVHNHGLEGKLTIVSQQGNETKLFHNELKMSFLCDGIIRYKGQYYILEIKTEISSKFWERQCVNPDHILQGTAYSVAFGIDKVLFLYECRDSCTKKTFMLEVTDKMKQDLVGKIMNCETYVADNTVPPKPTDLSKKACAYCPYTKVCERDGD